MSQIYYQVLPPNNLSDYLECIWVIKADNCGKIFKDYEILLPDFSPDIIFNYQDPYIKTPIESNSKLKKIRGLFLIGPRSSGFHIQHGSKIQMIGFKFKPWGLFYFFNFKIEEVSQKSIQLSEIFSDANQVEKDLFLAKDDYRRIQIMNQYLVSKLKKNIKLDADVIKLIDRIENTDDNLKLLEYYRQEGLDARTIERKFLRMVGLTPKEVMRIKRLNLFIRSKYKKSNSRFIKIINEQGFYDQSHLIKEFKHFTGQTPSIFLRENHKLVDLFVVEDLPCNTLDGY